MGHEADRPTDYFDLDGDTDHNDLHPLDLDDLSRVKGFELEMGAFELNCFADFDGRGVVDGGDLGHLLGLWGTCPLCDADLNCDGAVDGADLGALLGYWNEECYAESPSEMMMVSGAAGPTAADLVSYLGAASMEEAMTILSGMAFEEMRALLEAFFAGSGSNDS